MNRRNRVRFKTDITVKITTLDEPEASYKGRLANLSAHGLSLIMTEELPTGSVVRVEWGKTMFVGEVIYCQVHRDEFLVGLQVEDPVYDAKQPASSRKSVR
jgi:PilZ domain